MLASATQFLKRFRSCDLNYKKLLHEIASNLREQIASQSALFLFDSEVAFLEEVGADKQNDQKSKTRVNAELCFSYNLLELLEV